MSYIEIDLHHEWWDLVYDDFLMILEAAGVSAESKDIRFSGFWSQGDGASFTGRFYLSEAYPIKLRELLPEDYKYLADDLQELRAKHPEIQGKISSIGHMYCHSNTMVIGEYSSNDNYCDEFVEAFADDNGEERILSIFRTLADYLYSQLEEEYNFQVADQTCYRWDQALEEVAQHQSEMEELQTSFNAAPPSDKVQVAAIQNQLELLEDAIERAQQEAEQLAYQFHYWKDGKSMTIEEFHNEYF